MSRYLSLDAAARPLPEWSDPGALDRHQYRPPNLPRGVVDRLSTRGRLESPWIGIAFVVLFLAAVVLLVRVVRRRRGCCAAPRPVLAGSAARCSPRWRSPTPTPGTCRTRWPPRGWWASTPSNTGPGGRVPGADGTVRRYRLGAAALSVGAGPVWVYLPPGYDDPGNDARYPVVYLLHGFPGRSADWFAAGRVDATMNVLIGTRAMAPAIVVAPDMNGGGIAIHDTEGLNLAHGPQVQTYLARTVPDWADRTFRTVRGSDGRVIGGMSAGGYAALNLGLRHQDEFGGLIAEEPYGEPGTSLLPALGGDWAAYAAESPSTYLPTMTFSRPEPTFIDDGAAAPGNDPDASPTCYAGADNRCSSASRPNSTTPVPKPASASPTASSGSPTTRTGQPRDWTRTPLPHPGRGPRSSCAASNSGA